MSPRFVDTGTNASIARGVANSSTAPARAPRCRTRSATTRTTSAHRAPAREPNATPRNSGSGNVNGRTSDVRPTTNPNSTITDIEGTGVQSARTTIQTGEQDPEDVQRLGVDETRVEDQVGEARGERGRDDRDVARSNSRRAIAYSSATDAVPSTACASVMSSVSCRSRPIDFATQTTPAEPSAGSRSGGTRSAGSRRGGDSPCRRRCRVALLR